MILMNKIQIDLQILKDGIENNFLKNFTIFWQESFVGVAYHLSYE